jgi:hypothetical protein
MTHMRYLIACLVSALALVAAPAAAQTVPGPRVNLLLDQPMLASCESPTVMNAWNFTYGSCYRPAGVALGDPWISGIRVTFTGATTVSSVIPKSQVTLETTAARCSPGSAPCLRLQDVAAPAGPSNITMRFVFGEGTEGAPTAAIPFTGASPTVAATGPRIAQ